MSDANANVIATPTRDEIRKAVFASKKPATRVIKFFGQDIELRQPSLGQVLDNSLSDSEVSRTATIRALVNHAYVPGTDIKLFDDTDYEAFREMPFGADFVLVAKAFGELSELNFLNTVES